MGESSGRNGFLSHCLTVIRIDGWTMFLARFASCFPFVDAASTDAEEPAGEHQTELIRRHFGSARLDGDQIDERLTIPTSVIQTAFPSTADPPAELIRWRAIWKRTISKMKASNANVAPSEAKAVVVPTMEISRMWERMPKMVARNPKPAAMGWRTRT